MLCAIHARRVTVMPRCEEQEVGVEIVCRDMVLARRIRGREV